MVERKSVSSPGRLLGSAYRERRGVVRLLARHLGRRAPACVVQRRARHFHAERHDVGWRERVQNIAGSSPAAFAIERQPKNGCQGGQTDAGGHSLCHSFVKGCQILDNVFKLEFSVEQFLYTFGSDPGVFLFDVEAAFSSAAQEWIWMVLDRVGLPPPLQSALRALNADAFMNFSATLRSRRNRFRPRAEFSRVARPTRLCGPCCTTMEVSGRGRYLGAPLDPEAFPTFGAKVTSKLRRATRHISGLDLTTSDRCRAHCVFGESAAGYLLQVQRPVGVLTRADRAGLAMALAVPMHSMGTGLLPHLPSRGAHLIRGCRNAMRVEASAA